MDHQAHATPSRLAPATGSGPSPPPHVVIFPFPVQGHMNSMLKLAELLMLCLPGHDDALRITFLNTVHNHSCLLRCSDAASRFATHPNFCFRTISDGLPADAARSDDRLLEIFQHLKLTVREVLAELMAPGGDQSPPTCIIADGIMGFVVDVADEFGVRVVLFRTISAYCTWTYFCLPQLIEAGELPIQGNEDMDRLIRGIPGMEGILRCRDLPSFCRVADMSDPFLQDISFQTCQISRAQGLILNTFETLEKHVLDQIRIHCPTIYTVGPLNAHLKCRHAAANHSKPYNSTNSLWEEDQTCFEWLDKQPERSVVYVSFGSLANLQHDELMEFWHGLVNSKYRFLWVMRPGSVRIEDHVHAELRSATEERGRIIEWAPQEEVLSHLAIGGFLTHSGWNSTLESMTAGVPMLCWPYFADQQVNSRLVCKLWRIGLDMKDKCDRVVVETMINDLMVDKRGELSRSASARAKQAIEAVSEGGTSWNNMYRLIKNIQLISSTV